MIHAKLIIGTTALWAAVPAMAELPPELVKAVAAYDKAQIEGDGVALNALLDDDYVLINSRGQRETKAEFVAESTAPGFKLEPFVVEEPVELVWDGSALTGGVATLHGTDGGKPFTARLRFSDFWIKRSSGWRVVYTHASREVLK
jgi:hypothetical protein